ncbi:lactose permease [Clostridium pasteurianum DSM 525 = ATCC 6013]|uniref:Lactose permease n=1 Tax=Clostridium pasteurianum DSM 525 = ATCC 6013 TaxID=1262449 RepID=A0A0H3J1T7_CLOPA|nr:glycoside-pentoside-hexuronide (GPH):cation symporter [Clostridium pasteurianum]AJA46667.1 lactose permease [Clostridium pasteurianum DSM 525 = ATCC 6013]AJA50655.1 lactose permease [Clostridium pasteurianum DSM 525 = ATCC 6013]AOZ74077.1 sodium:solute symporter [Clostridium pasteurianum DSM 525 = ATCC 6013]ELP61232.1 Na+/xyloside symporter related transporter [Clostridium pasteurianum DSM 525 = ATCC 6013]KRU13333.1 sugar (Glycoside-Pentoside-Hexuronide) transporter [Clostridium pasteurianu
MKQKISYALGAFGHDIYYGTLSTYFMIFVTKSMFEGAPKATQAKMIALVTTLVVGIRLVEIVFDPIIGGIIDNTKTKWGKFRPWLCVGGTISAICLVMLFTNFFGLATSNETLFTIVFIFVFIILDSTYSFKDIAFWSMIPALTEDSRERGKIATIARFASSLGSNGTTLAVVPIVSFFTLVFTGHSGQAASGWFAFGVIAAVIYGVTSWIAALGTKENNSILRQQKEKISVKDTFNALAKNDQLMWVSLSYLLFAIGYIATTAVLMLYFQYVIGNIAAFSIVGVVSSICGIISVPLFPVVTKFISRKYIYTLGIVAMLISYLLFSTASSNLVLVIIGLVFFYFPYQLIFLSVLMTISDSIEYGQWKNGVRNEAVTLSLRPLLDKIAGALSNGIVGFISVACGMMGNAQASDITAQGISTFKLYSFYLPGALMIVSAVIFLFKIKLTEKRHAEIVKDLEVALEKTTNLS